MSSNGQGQQLVAGGKANLRGKWDESRVQEDG